MSDRLVERSLGVCRKLLHAAVQQEFTGFDPFDALNSRLFQKTPLSGSRAARLIWTQIHKRVPVNLRQAIGVSPHVNPKSLALFLSGVTDLEQREPGSTGPDIQNFLAQGLQERSRTGYAGACWGYPFPWQARAFYLPTDTPTVVATAYSAIALLDAGHQRGESRWMELARSACEFVLHDLNRTAAADGICFSYSPLDDRIVHNASLLGARLLARVGKATGEGHLVDAALDAARFTVAHQGEDGAWVYGSTAYHRWVDGFHTGFVLDCIRDCYTASGEAWLKDSFDRGLAYYRERLFLGDGTPRYFDSQTYPIDAHSYGQALVTLSAGGPREKALARKVAACSFRDLWHPSGYFCYQRRKTYRNQINYLRWSQAWMFRGLAAFVRSERDENLD